MKKKQSNGAVYRSAKVIMDIPTLPHIKRGDRVNVEFFAHAKDMTRDGREIAFYKAWRPGMEATDAFFLFEPALADFSPLPADKHEKFSFH